jgi:hypothetical protein
MRIPLAAALVLAGLTANLWGANSSLSPGQTLQLTFTATPNLLSDMLIFFTNDALTVTGSPIITTQLYDGSTLLGTVVAPPVNSSGSQYYQVTFQSPSSTWIPSGPFATVNLAPMQNGTIQGTIRITISGGAISGLNTTDFVLYDAMSNGTSGFSIQHDVTHGPVVITSPSNVPALSQWGLACLAIALAAVGAAATGYSRAPKVV